MNSLSAYAKKQIMNVIIFLIFVAIDFKYSNMKNIATLVVFFLIITIGTRINKKNFR